MRHTILRFVVLVLVLTAGHAAAQDAERIELEIGEETTFFTGPVTEDGIIDYVAALNAHYGEGIENEDNAYVFLLGLFPWEEVVAEYWALFYAEMGYQPDPQRQRFVMVDDYAESIGLDVDDALEMYSEAENGPWSAETYPALAEWLALNEPVFQELKNLIEYERYFSPLFRRVHDEAVPEIWLPHLGLLRILGRGLNIHAQAALGRGDLDTAVDDAIVLNHLGALASNEITHIGKLVGLSIWTIERSLIESIAGSGTLDHASAVRLLQARRDAPPAVSIVDSINLAERCAALDVVQRSGIGQDPGWAFFWDDEEVGRRASRIYLRLAIHPRFNINQSLGQLNELFDAIQRNAQLASFHARNEADVAFDHQVIDSFTAHDRNDLQAIDHHGDWPEGWTDVHFTAVVTAMYSRRMVTHAGASSRTEWRSKVRRTVESVAIALLGYRDVHGELPGSLDALAPTYFEAVPLDPFSDEPLVYRVDPDGSALVYSIGSNFRDDGGVDDYAEGDIAIRIGPPPAD